MRPIRRQTLNERVRAHLGGSEAPYVIHRTFPDYLAGDVAIAIKEYLNGLTAEVLRFSGDPLTLFQTQNRAVQRIAPPVLEQLEVPGERLCQGLREGLALFRFKGVPMIAYCRWEDAHPQSYSISIVARSLDGAEQVLSEFSAFAESRRAITSALFARVAGSLNARLRAHLGDGEVPSVLTHAFPQYQITNISIQVKDFFDRLGAEFTGIGAAHGLDFTGFRGGTDPLALLKPAAIDRFGHFEGYDQMAPAFEQIEIDGASTRLGLREGVTLFRFEDVPMFACGRRSDGMHQEYQLTIVARELSRAQRVLNAFLAHERANSILRGRLIRPEIDYSDRVRQAEILPFAEVGWDQVVLPKQLRQRIERDVLEYIRAADRLTANDIPPKRSVLFHGPPGTGKSFMCKLLATELRGFTSVLITGDNLRRPEAAFALARSFAPALLFFEDVDLVAKDRDGTPCPMALGGLLNELDGLPQSDRIYVVFTTNRLDVLEEALAQRPGRVDMIVGFPLPEAPLRRRLIRLYAGTAGVDDADVEWVVERTDGVTPAFLREFMKEAVFTAIRAGTVDEHGIATVGRCHLAETFERFAEIRREHGADRILGFRA